MESFLFQRQHNSRDMHKLFPGKQQDWSVYRRIFSADDTWRIFNLNSDTYERLATSQSTRSAIFNQKTLKRKVFDEFIEHFRNLSLSLSLSNSSIFIIEKKEGQDNFFLLNILNLQGWNLFVVYIFFCFVIFFLLLLILGLSKSCSTEILISR